MAATATRRDPEARGAGRVPGEPGTWVLVLGEMTLFLALFVAFLVGRADDPELFAAGTDRLEVGFGLADTAILLTSSLLVAAAVRLHRAGRPVPAARSAAAAGLCALLFVVSKAVEWAGHAGDGDGPTADPFWTLYYTVTGMHLLHVLVGSLGLVLLHRRVRRPTGGPGDRVVIEGAASYWHMVDLLWVLILPLVYLASA